MSNDDNPIVVFSSNMVTFDARPTYTGIKLTGPYFGQTYNAQGQSYTITGKIDTVIGIAPHAGPVPYAFSDKITFQDEEDVSQTGPDARGIIYFTGAESKKVAQATAIPQ